jgi:hypothetical protein
VTFQGEIDVPPGAGVVVKAEWDLEGGGDYPVVSDIASQSHVSVKTTYAFSKPGTYFPALRVTSSRDGDATSPYAQILNLARVRVVVT